MPSQIFKNKYPERQTLFGLFRYFIQIKNITTTTLQKPNFKKAVL